jgi:uncharacterized protein YbjT (DUF2867 family)
MSNRILVTGGTGTLGRAVTRCLLDSGAQVHVLSRGRRPPGPAPQVVGDVKTGEGLAEALTGVDTIVHCAVGGPADRLVEAAGRSGTPHLVYPSIVGVDRVPLGYYQRKLADEQLISDSGLPWTVLRATQFHDLVAAMFRVLGTPRIMFVPAGWSFQPIDVRDVGAQLATLAQGGAAGRVPDIGGPEVSGVANLAHRYLAEVDKHRPVVSIRLPGRVSRGYRAGGNLVPDRAVGAIPFERYLDEQLAAGTAPYRDAVKSYFRFPPRSGKR